MLLILGNFDDFTVLLLNVNIIFTGEKDMRSSKQRDLILNTIVNNPVHPTAKQVYEMARKKMPNISLGTVYRNLSALAEAGLIRHIAVSDDCDRYDGRLDKHLHIICNGCGKVEDFEPDKYFDLERYVETKTGYKLDEMNIVMRGYCSDCQKKLNEDFFCLSETQQTL